MLFLKWAVSTEEIEPAETKPAWLQEITKNGSDVQTEVVEQGPDATDDGASSAIAENTESETTEPVAADNAADSGKQIAVATVIEGENQLSDGEVVLKEESNAVAVDKKLNGGEIDLAAESSGGREV